MVGLLTLKTVIIKWVVVPILTVCGSIIFLPDLVPSWDALWGRGTLGTFTATHQVCGRRIGCEIRGTWKAYGDNEGSRTDAHGEDQGSRTDAYDNNQGRTNVVLYDSPPELDAGLSTPALDTGAHGVFSPGAWWSPLLNIVLSLATIGSAVRLIYILSGLRRLRRWWRSGFGSRSSQQPAESDMLSGAGPFGR